MEIYYFERIVRALSGDDDFAVPYWNFTDPAAAKRAAPASFRSPTYGSKPVPNPLYYSLRRAGINDGKPLCKEVIDWSEAFKKDKFWVPAGMGNASFGGTKKTFLIHGILGPGTGELEDQPHNSVHATVGLSQRESKLWFLSLYSADGAGLDPLFWPIHVNLDRAWYCWQGKHPGTFPDTNTSLWATQKFKFFDAEKVSLKGPDGKEEVTWKAKEVCLTGKQVVDIAKQLNYKYTDCDPFPPITEPEDMANLSQVADLYETPPDVAWKTMETPVNLGANPVTVSVNLPADVQERIRRILAGEAKDGSIALELEGIQMNQPVDTLYEVYLNLPAQPQLDWQGRYFVGLLNFFGIGHHHHAGAAETVQAANSARSFDVTEVVRRLAANNEWRGDKVSVTFVVAQPDPAEDCVMPTAPTVDEHISFAQLTLGGDYACGRNALDPVPLHLGPRS